MPSFTFSDGLNVAYQEWGHGNAKRVVLSHGYMDNSNSFKILGPYLAEHGFHAVALDHIGHGHSDHLGAGGSYSMHGIHVSAMRHLTDTLKWEKCYVVGHSMGSNIAVMFAACYPERVEKMILMEGVGPMVKPASSAPKYLRGAIDTEIIIKKKTGGRSKWYPSFGEAIEARLQAVKHYPGEQEHVISRAAVAAIVARGVRLGEDRKDEEPVIESDGPVQFRHDTKLLYPSSVYFTAEQAMAFIDAVNSPTLVILAESGFPTSFYHDFDGRMNILQSKGLLTLQRLPGQHHLHLDEEHATNTAQSIVAYLNI